MAHDNTEHSQSVRPELRELTIDRFLMSYPFIGQACESVRLQGFEDLVEELALSHCPASPVTETLRN